MWLNLMEEKFFFLYHMNLSWNLFQKMPINERKWTIERFIQQKDKEILESTFRAKKEFMAQKILNEEIQKMINISEDDVELYFRANKDKYAEKDEKGNFKRQKSFQEAAQLAANDLMREKQEKAYTQLLERLMKAQNVKIFESKIR